MIESPIRFDIDHEIRKENCAIFHRLSEHGARKKRVATTSKYRDLYTLMSFSTSERAKKNLMCRSK